MSAPTIDLHDTMTDPLDWLGLLEPGWEPEGFREALEARERTLDLHAACSARQDATTAALTALVGAHDPDPKQVQAAALDVAAAREVLTVLPAVPTVAEHYGEQIVDRIGGWFRERAAFLGCPPLIVGEVRHGLEMHQGQPGPRMTDREHEALPLFQAAAAEAYRMSAQVVRLSAPLGSESIANRVASWHGFREQYVEHAALLLTVRRLVDEVDAERLASPSLHRCPLWGGQHVGHLMSVEAFHQSLGPWTEAKALRDGVPARPALSPVGVS